MRKTKSQQVYDPRDPDQVAAQIATAARLRADEEAAWSLDRILANVADQDRGKEFELLDPVNRTPTGIKLWIVGPDSPTAHAARLALTDEMAEMADDDGRLTAAQREKARLNCLARHVQRWEVSEGGQPLPFSTKNLLRLLRVHWVHEQVDAFAADRAAHRGAA